MAGPGGRGQGGQAGGEARREREEERGNTSSDLGEELLRRSNMVYPGARGRGPREPVTGAMAREGEGSTTSWRCCQGPGQVHK